jgi:hypothetical protein
MKSLYTLGLAAAAWLGATAPAHAQTGTVLGTYQVGTTTLTASALATGLDTPWEYCGGPITSCG